MWKIGNAALLSVVLVVCQAKPEVIYRQDVDGKAQAIEIMEDNLLTRTQYLPIKKQVKLEVLSAEDEQITPRCDMDESEDKRIVDSSYEMKNGKMYKINRVRKKRKRIPCKNEKQKAHRRSFDEFQNNSFNHSSADLMNEKPFIEHLPTASRRNGSRSESRIRNNMLYNWIPKLSSGYWQMDNTSSNPLTDGSNQGWRFWTNAHPLASKAIERKKEKLKKLLNLFTIVKFDNNGCIVDGLKGTCYNEQECTDRSGRVLGACARGFGVCCYIERSCGQSTRENCTYFVNEGFPNPSNAAPRICALTVDKANADVRQLRLEFETFELRGPVNGTCLVDRFLITGQNRNSIVPDLCGVNTGQHVHVDVDATIGPFSLNVVTMGQEVGRKFRIKVTQLRAGDALLAPQNCLQYYTELSGTVETFNYQYTVQGNAGEAVPGYFNNMNYDICIKKSADFCSVTYMNEAFGQAPMPFELINYEEDGEPLIPRGQAGAEVFNCPDDYVVVNGIRLCGDRLNDATVQLDYTRNAPVTDFSAGPAYLTVKTDLQNTSRGFRFLYKQNPCTE